VGTDLKGRTQSSRMQLLPPGTTATAPAAYSTPLSRGNAPNRSRLQSAFRHARGTGSEFANSIVLLGLLALAVLGGWFVLLL